MTVSHTTAPAPAPVPTVTQPLAHPTACPAWCKDRDQQMNHYFGPTSTFHWSPQYTVSNPCSVGGGRDVVLRAELCVSDKDDREGEASLCIQGESNIELSSAEADIFIANMQAFVDTLRVLRGQMARTARA